MTEREVDALLIEFFTSKGLKPIPLAEMSAQGEEKPDLAFADGRTTTYLKVFGKHDLQQRDALLQAVLSSMSYARAANRVYLVLPKVQATIVDAAPLRERGLGLIVYDSKRIEEVLPSSIFNHDTATAKATGDLERLTSRIAALERTVETLLSELSRIKALKLEQLEPSRIPSRSPMAVELQSSERLPSFLQDNPWLEILSRRGREPEHVAS